MIAVSDAWKQKQFGFLAPEGFVELSYLVSEDGLQEDAIAISLDESPVSNIHNVVNVYEELEKKFVTTNEMNLWLLDGSRKLHDETGTGYVSSSFGSGELKISLSKVHEQPLQGITIQWCSEFNEYATKFNIVAYRGDTIVASHSVEGNTNIVSEVEFEIDDYDSIVVKVLEWSVPQHRVRIERVTLGITKVYTKKDLMGYTHSQTGSPVSGELPKNSIEFILDNSDGKWNPNNPTGYERYLSERQKITVRYGFDIDGTVEWIKGGTFYLSEWKTPSNGIQATFTARDLLEYMIEEPYTGRMQGTLYEICSEAIELADFPRGAKVALDDCLKNYEAQFDGEYSCAEILQMSANASKCVMYQDRNGILRVERKNHPVGDVSIDGDVSYSFPEIDLLKPLKSISVSYGEASEFILNENKTGEVQTVTNPFISTETQADEVARWISDTLKFRKNVSGEYRADPRLDLFDKVRVESKYGTNNAVLITDIKYSFSGAFRGTYSGIATEFTPVPAAYCGEIFAGEV